MLTASSSRALRSLAHPSKRAYHDLITLPSKRAAVSAGPPGYSAVTGHVVTVFGCTGFLGRYVVAKLAKMGTQVIIPYRDEDEKRHLKLMGDLGQVVPMEWDIRSEQQIAECLRHSDLVYNLTGRNFDTKNFDMASVHVAGAERIAKIAAESGVSRLVHVSHLNASHTSPSTFYRTKAEGEDRVKAAFPRATIVKPGTMYGSEDKLLNNMATWSIWLTNPTRLRTHSLYTLFMATWSIWWKLNQAQTKTRPVHVMDVAQALANLMRMPELARTIALPGPSTLTHEYLLELVASVTMRPPSGAPVLPKKVALALARAAQAVWWPALSPDEVIRRYIDDVDTPGDWDLVGVTPSEIESNAITYLRRYRTAENYVRPAVFPSRPEAAQLSS